MDPQNNLCINAIPLELHYRLSNSPSNAFNLAEFLWSSPDNPALEVSIQAWGKQVKAHSHCNGFQNFIPKLKDYLLSLLLNCEYDGDKQTFSIKEWSCVQFINNLNRVLHSKHLQINYTIYNSAMIKTHCILVMALWSCCFHRRMVQMPILFGTPKYLGHLLLQLTMLALSITWNFYGSTGLVLSLDTTGDLRTSANQHLPLQTCAELYRLTDSTERYLVIQICTD